MGAVKLVYVPISDLNNEMKKLVKVFNLGNDGFILVRSKFVANPRAANAIYTENGNKFDRSSYEKFNIMEGD